MMKKFLYETYEEYIVFIKKHIPDEAIEKFVQKKKFYIKLIISIVLLEILIGTYIYMSLDSNNAVNDTNKTTIKER